jgi:hypothetical protein
VFNLCEIYKKEVDNAERFCKCPDSFYDVAKGDSIKKIEELYLLIHRKTDLVFYLTTKSHKYISNDQKGFLNDRKLYENNIVLKDIESIYIGRYDSVNQLIHFPSFKDEKDIILNFQKDTPSDNITFTRANLATAENNFDISEPIGLDKLFNEKLIYKRRSDYKMSYRYKDTLRIVDRIYITSKKGEIGVMLGFSNLNDYFDFKNHNIKYHPNYSLIQRH